MYFQIDLTIPADWSNILTYLQNNLRKGIRYEDNISSEYESEYDDDRLCYHVHDVHDGHGLLVYASDYLIF